jgi:polysaccharide export outer membrane protein
MNTSLRSLVMPLLLTLAAASGAAQAQRNPPPAPPQAQQQATPAVAPQYRLSQGDIVRITVFQNPDLSIETRINESGAISYPLLGNVTLSGLTITDAEQRIARGLRDGQFVRQPQVTINISQVRGNQVSVLGHVGRPTSWPPPVVSPPRAVTSSSSPARARVSRSAPRSNCRRCSRPTGAAPT